MSHQFPWIDLKGPRDTKNVVQRDVHLSALYLPEIGPVQLTAISERLLAETEFEAPLADTAPELGRCRRQRRLAGGSGHALKPIGPKALAPEALHPNAMRRNVASPRPRAETRRQGVDDERRFMDGRRTG